MMKKFCIIFCCCVLLLRVSADVIFADATTDQLEQQIADLTQKLSDAKNQDQTLSSAISYLNTKQTLTQKQIQATQYQITLLEKDIDSLTGKIGLLEQSLNQQTSSLLVNVQSSYKHRGVSDLELLLSPSDFGDVVARYRYLVATQQYRQDMLVKTTQTQLEYNQEKDVQEQKKESLAALQKQFQQQQQDLANQQQAKQQLLNQTRDSEANYQSLLNQAIAQLNSLRGFSSSMGGGLLDPSQTQSPDGWYFSQRDSRWGNMCIGNSCGTKNEATIMEVGCLLTDIAMVKKKYGENVTPMSIAANSSYFFSTTAYMLEPWPAPAGKHWERGSFDQNKVKADLQGGTPVIAHLRINSGDGHFIVLKAMNGNDMIMHDPWEGYDKKFTDFYNTSQITDVSYLR